MHLLLEQTFGGPQPQHLSASIVRHAMAGRTIEQIAAELGLEPKLIKTTINYAIITLGHCAGLQSED